MRRVSHRSVLFWASLSWRDGTCSIRTLPPAIVSETSRYSPARDSRSRSSSRSLSRHALANSRTDARPNWREVNGRRSGPRHLRDA